jgi:toxin YoeB
MDRGMTAAKRRHTGRHEKSPVIPDDEQLAILLGAFRRDLGYWISANPRIALRVMRIIEEILATPYAGIGKPEPLKHDYAGDWSRRITDEDRLVYRVTSMGIYFSRARGHYSRR